MSKAIYDFIAMSASLNEAADKAGGACYDVQRLKGMTALELVVELATNDVRFVYTGAEKLKAERVA